MEKRFKFTTNKIASLPPNDPNSRSTEAEYSCSELSGFKVLVGKNGRKKWLVRYTLNGRKGSLSLGTFPEVSLADARKQAQRTKLMVAEGVDPKNSTVKPDIPTVSEYFNNHFIKISKSRKKSWRHDIARFNHCVEIWDISYDQLRVSHIQSMVAGLIDKVHLRGKKLSRSTINRVLCLLKLMGRMIEEEYSIPNVAARVKLFPET